MLLRGIVIKEDVITGVLTNICVLFTAGDAFMRGYKVIIPEDSVASVSEEDHKFALKLMKEVLKAEII